MDTDKRHFELKGKRAEALLYSLARDTFLEGWCYLNPRLPNGKELCDLLVVFGEYAIIWQVKDLKLGKDGRYSRKKVEKNLRQLVGAKRQLLECRKSLQLENPRRGMESFDPSFVKRVFLVSALLGDGEDVCPIAEVVKDGLAHTFTRESGEIVLNELDTIADFIGYFAAKEDLFTSTARVIVGGGEEDLLAFYLENGRSLDQLKSMNLDVIEGGRWNAFVQSNSYKTRAAANEISYGWDSLIARAHEAEGQYELIARELARPNRVMRRGLAEAFADAALIADAEQDRNVMRKVIATSDMTYCFLFAGETVPQEARANGLANMCFVARGLHRENVKVVGIATEMKIGLVNSYDFFFIEMNDWTDADQDQMQQIQAQQKILIGAKPIRLDVNEYPD
jgi:hypothetical protein